MNKLGLHILYFMFGPALALTSFNDPEIYSSIYSDDTLVEPDPVGFGEWLDKAEKKLANSKDDLNSLNSIDTSLSKDEIGNKKWLEQVKSRPGNPVGLDIHPRLNRNNDDAESMKEWIRRSKEKFSYSEDITNEKFLKSELVGLSDNIVRDILNSGKIKNKNGNLLKSNKLLASNSANSIKTKTVPFDKWIKSAKKDESFKKWLNEEVAKDINSNKYSLGKSKNILERSKFGKNQITESVLSSNKNDYISNTSLKITNEQMISIKESKNVFTQKQNKKMVVSHDPFVLDLYKQRESLRLEISNEKIKDIKYRLLAQKQILDSEIKEAQSKVESKIESKVEKVIVPEATQNEIGIENDTQRQEDVKLVEQIRKEDEKTLKDEKDQVGKKVNTNLKSLDEYNSQLENDKKYLINKYFKKEDEPNQVNEIKSEKDALNNPMPNNNELKANSSGKAINSDELAKKIYDAQQKKIDEYNKMKKNNEIKAKSATGENSEAKSKAIVSNKDKSTSQIKEASNKEAKPKPEIIAIPATPAPAAIKQQPKRQVIVMQGPKLPKLQVKRNAMINSINITEVKTKKMYIDDEYKLAINEVNEGLYVSAEKKFKEILNKVPAHYKSRIELSKISLKYGDITKAKEILEEGLLINSRQGDLIGMLATLYQQEGNYKQSLNILNRLPENYFASERYMGLIASAYQGSGNFELASEYYSKLVNLNSYEYRWWLGLALSKDSLGYKPQALKAYRNVKRLGNIDLEVFNFVNERIKLLSGNDL